MVQEAMHIQGAHTDVEVGQMSCDEMDEETKKFFKLLQEAEIELLPGYSFSDGANLPANYYEAQKITTDLGFTYETIDACPGNCMLFRGKDSGLNKCEICNASRYKDDKKKDCREENEVVAENILRDTSIDDYIPAKVTTGNMNENDIYDCSPVEVC
ncbi:hypothetical protein BUALT_Bualt06G0101100 [Buddleja alternifolia]|uniref:Uncharacterized protein n=1 Tax=Buddleja alternifolia TaxID=168488 RepID=A0AAV6XLU4_9LAMI|nr:hypothetical protein BUALT_Bualt06G0101100 [Buddleja alternifolia]